MEEKIDKLIEELRLNNKLLSMILAEKKFENLNEFEEIKKFGEYFDRAKYISHHILRNIKK